MRNTIGHLADGIDRAIAAIGRAAIWCCLYLVLVEFAVVVMRYALGMGSIRLQESVLYAHAGLFMLGAAWTLQVDGHVRVDIFYAQAKPRTRAVVDLIGALVFLIPFAALLAVLSIPYVGRSWAILESSREASGLPFVYLLKTLIPLFAVLIGLQGVAQAIRAALVLSGPHAPSLPSPARGGGKINESSPARGGGKIKESSPARGGG
jgi:TRAP-type mannitol/chloroaromatic compound transport system permease small subunit